MDVGRFADVDADFLEGRAEGAVAFLRELVLADRPAVFFVLPADFFDEDFLATFFRDAVFAVFLPAFFALAFFAVFFPAFLAGFFAEAFAEVLADVFAGRAAFFRLVAFLRATAFFFDVFFAEDFLVEAFFVLNLRLLLALVVPADFLPAGFFPEADFFLLTPARLLLLAAFFAGISLLLPVEKNAELYIG